jgi:hypothetical protein
MATVFAGMAEAVAAGGSRGFSIAWRALGGSSGSVPTGTLDMFQVIQIA